MKSQSEKIIHAYARSYDDEANESHDVVYDFDVSERRVKCKIKQLLTSKGNELAQTLLNSVEN